MYLHEMNWDIFEKCLKENEYVILGILSEDSILNNFFKANLKKMNKKINNNIVIGVMNSAIYKSRRKFDSITPKICLYKNKELVKEIFGFKRYKKVLDELGITNLTKKIA